MLERSEEFRKKQAEKTRELAQRIDLDEVKKRIRKLGTALKVLTKEGNFDGGVYAEFKVKCKECGAKWKTTWETLRKFGRCTSCNPHKYGHTEDQVRKVLERLTGHKFPPVSTSKLPWLYGLRLDGYCSRLKTAFEFQGPHHYSVTSYGGSKNKDTEEKLRERKLRDKRKRFQCSYHKVNLLCIPYWKKDIEGYIKTKLEAMGIV